MLAGGCGAGPLPDTSDAQAVDAVRRIVEARQRDGQLRKAASTAVRGTGDRAFVQVWRRMHHRRIPPISRY